MNTLTREEAIAKLHTKLMDYVDDDHSIFEGAALGDHKACNPGQ